MPKQEHSTALFEVDSKIQNYPGVEGKGSIYSEVYPQNRRGKR
jgi:hypothetical protein